MPSSRLAVLLSTIALALVVGACGGDDDEPTGSAGGAAAPAADACSTDRLALKEPGTLTVGTDKPAFPPYFEDDDPTNGKGFESAVAYAVAGRARLRERPRSSGPPSRSTPPTRPAPKQFDFDINQISITPQRAERVDFSEPYFTAPQAVVALKASDGRQRDGPRRASRTRSSASRSARRASRPSRASIKPSSDPQVFNDSNDTVRALKAGRVDAIVVDLPTAFFLTAAEVPEAKIVGQFAAPGGDDWGLLLEKGSALTPCVNQALEELRSRGDAPGPAGPVHGRRRGTRAELSAAAATVGRRAAREAARRRRARRDRTVATVSTLVVLGALAAAILTSKGWPTVRETFFSWESFRTSFPDVLRGFWLDVAPVRGRGDRGARARPARRAVPDVDARPRSRRCGCSARVYVDVLRGVPTILVVYLIGFGVPALELVRRADATRSCSAASPSRSPTAPTSPRSTARGSTRSTRASAPRRSPSA